MAKVSINKIDNNTIEINGRVVNAVFRASAKGDRISLRSNEYAENTINEVYSDFEINGVAPTSAIDGYEKLTAFVGLGFKSSGGSGTGTQDHNALNNLSFAASGHTGFESSENALSHYQNLLIHVSDEDRQKWGTIQTIGTIWVNGAAPSGGDGTLTRPFNTIQAGIDAAPFGWKVSIAPGDYTGNVIFNNRENITIESQESVIGQYRVVVSGSLTIIGNSRRIGIKGIQFDNNYTCDTTEGLIYIDNIAVRGTSSITRGGTSSGYHRYDDCFFFNLNVSGSVLLEMIDSRCENNSSWTCSTTGTGACIFTNCLNAKFIHHSGFIGFRGSTNVLPVGDNVGVLSDANEGMLWIENLNLIQGDTFAFASIKKTGTCPYFLGLFAYDTSSTFTGTLIAQEKLQTSQINGIDAYTKLYDVNSVYNTVLIRNNHSYTNSSGSNVGAIKIKMPASKQSSMIIINLELYDYYSGDVAKIQIGAYDYSEGWTKAKSNVSGFFNKNIRLGYDTAFNESLIIIGDISSTWSYIRVRIVDVFVSYSGYRAYQANTFPISLMTDDSTIQYTNVEIFKTTRLDNTVAFTPTLATHLTTKSYVDGTRGIFDVIPSSWNGTTYNNGVVTVNQYSRFYCDAGGQVSCYIKLHYNFSAKPSGEFVLRGLPLIPDLDNSASYYSSEITIQGVSTTKLFAEIKADGRISIYKDANKTPLSFSSIQDTGDIMCRIDYLKKL